MQEAMNRRLALSLPPMCSWPRPVKIMVFGAGAVICAGAYAALVCGIVSLLALLVEAG